MYKFQFASIVVIALIESTGVLGSEALPGNLIFNSGFELGDVGLVCCKYLQPEVNPRLQYEGPTVDAEASISGKPSLRIPNRFGEFTRLDFVEIALKPGTTYTFSATMKTTAPNGRVNVNLESLTLKGWDNYGTRFMVGPVWKRQKWTFTTRPNWNQPWHILSLGFARETTAQPGELWLNDLQLVEGQSADYHPQSTLEAAVVSERTYWIKKNSNDQGTAQLRVVNHSQMPVNTKFNVAAVENTYGWPLFVRNVDVQLKPGEKQVIPISFPLDKYGAYRLETNVDKNFTDSFSSQPQHFAIVGDYVPLPLDLTREFCIGLNLSAWHFRPEAWHIVEKPGFRACNASPDRQMAMFRDMGIRLARDWGTGTTALRWSVVEAKEGQFDFTLFDQIYALMHKNGLALMPVLGDADFLCPLPDKPNHNGGGWPTWLIARSKRIQNRMGKAVYLPPLELWRRYIREVARHCRGKITHYEICNEPNLYLNATEYLPYLQAAYEELKQVDPAVKIVGFCATGDMGGALGYFLNECMKNGGLNYADVISFHPYDAPHLGAPVPADRQIAGIKNMLAKYGKPNMPLWNTELYYVHGKTNNDYLEADRHTPHYALWRCLTDLGEGLSQSTSLCGNQVLENVVAGHLRNSWGETTPSGDLVAYNALARLLEGSRPYAKLQWPNDGICYVYQRNGKLLAACWNYGDIKGVRIKLAESAIHRFDLYGNLQPATSSWLPLTALPWYLEPPASMSNEAFMALLRNVPVEAEEPLTSGPARLLPRSGIWSALVPVRNCTNRELSGRLSVKGADLSAAKPIAFSLPANTEKAITVPVEFQKRNAAYDFTATVKCESKTITFPVNKHILLPKVYHASRKNGSLQTVFGSKGTASFSVRYDDHMLILEIQVKDSVPSGPSNGRAPWNQDCIELFIDTRPEMLPSRGGSAFTDYTVKLMVLPYVTGNEQVVISSSGTTGIKAQTVSVKTALEKDGYSAKILLSLSELGLRLPLKGKCLGFEIYIDFADTIARQGVSCWGSGWKAHENRLSFGVMMFE